MTEFSFFGWTVPLRPCSWKTSIRKVLCKLSLCSCAGLKRWQKSERICDVVMMKTFRSLSWCFFILMQYYLMCGQSVVSQHAIHDNKSPLCLCCTADGFQHQGNKLSFVDVRLISLVPMLFYIVSNGRLPNVFCQNKYFLHALLLEGIFTHYCKIFEKCWRNQV